MTTKVCGLKEPDNIAAVSALSVDLIGLIFHAESPRYVGDLAPEKLFPTAEKPERPARVGVFVNAEVDYLLNAVHDYQLDWVQLHGNESPGYCQELQLLWSVSSNYKARIIKAFGITPDFDFNETNAYVSSCPLFLFDTGGQATPGGSGKSWDWGGLAKYQGLTPFLLSGGIGPKDAAMIKSIDHPQFRGVDLNSRFETQPGHKDVSLLRNFLADLS